MKHDLCLSHGFDAGNYAGAYDRTDLETALAGLSTHRSVAYHVAFTLGFLSSYAIDEMSAEEREAFQEAYHSDECARMIDLGIAVERDADELACLDSELA